MAALLHLLPRGVLGRFRLLIRPDTVLRWHRDTTEADLERMTMRLARALHRLERELA